VCIQPGIPFTSAHSGDVHYPSIRAPLDIETDIPFCRSILPVDGGGGGGSGARVENPLSLRPPSPPPPTTPPPREALQPARPSRRRLLVFSVSVPSAVGREPRVPSDVSRCLARGGYRASLRAARKQPGDNRGEITSNSEKKYLHARARARDVPQNFSRRAADDTRGTSFKFDAHMSVFSVERT